MGTTFAKKSSRFEVIASLIYLLISAIWSSFSIPRKTLSASHIGIITRVPESAKERGHLKLASKLLPFVVEIIFAISSIAESIVLFISFFRDSSKSYSTSSGVSVAFSLFSVNLAIISFW